MRSNEIYLYVWYWGALTLAVITALAIWAYLRAPFAEIADRLRSSAVTRALKQSFPLGLLLPILGGFLGVNMLSLDSCHMGSYERLVTDRDYMVVAGQKQLSEVLTWSIEAVWIWAVMTFLILVAIRTTTKQLPERAVEPKKTIGITHSCP